MKGRSITMKLTFWQRCAIATVGGIAVLGTASPAFAFRSDTTGAAAYGNKDGIWRVYDTKCDGHTAYGLFVELGTSGSQRKNNDKGCDTKSEGDIGKTIIAVKACRNVRTGPDNCGGWNE